MLVILLKRHVCSTSLVSSPCMYYAVVCTAKCKYKLLKNDYSCLTDWFLTYYTESHGRGQSPMAKSFFPVPLISFVCIVPALSSLMCRTFYLTVYSLSDWSNGDFVSVSSMGMDGRNL